MMGTQGSWLYESGQWRSHHGCLGVVKTGFMSECGVEIDGLVLYDLKSV